jgi:hypothetical protein
MTIKELREQLSQYPETTKVYVPNGYYEGFCKSPVDKIEYCRAAVAGVENIVSLLPNQERVKKAIEQAEKASEVKVGGLGDASYTVGGN